MKIFDDLPKNITAYQTSKHSDYEYLNRSDRIEAEVVRNLMEEWIVTYPQSSQLEMIRRLRSKNEHLSSFFELIIYQLLHKEGFLLEAHPTVSNTSKKPEFLITSSTGGKFYLEAITTEGVSDKEKGGERILQKVYDLVENLHSPDFFINVDSDGFPNASIKESNLRKNLQNWINNLVYSEVIENDLTGTENPEFAYTENGLSLRFSVMPKRKCRNKPNGRNIGVQFPGIKIGRTSEIIANAIKRKATRYGDLNLPYVIAINVFGYPFDMEDLYSAFFGTLQYVERLYNDGSVKTGCQRKNDGILGARNTRVSAILCFYKATPWDFASRKVFLFHNPNAKKRLEDFPSNVPQFEVKEGKLISQPEKTLGKIFNLPLGWPES